MQMTIWREVEKKAATVRKNRCELVAGLCPTERGEDEEK